MNNDDNNNIDNNIDNNDSNLLELLKCARYVGTPKHPRVLKLLCKYTIGIPFIHINSYKTFEKLGFSGFSGFSGFLGFLGYD